MASVQCRVQLAYTSEDPASTARRLQEIREVMDLCTDRFECRRMKLLRPYGGYKEKNCYGNCDNCFSREENVEKFERIDVSTAARRLLKLYRDERNSVFPDKRITRAQFTVTAHQKLKIQVSDGQGTFTPVRPPKALLEQLVCHMFQECVFNLKPFRPANSKVSSMV
jgi:superfamily II DNA helicase RecQ